MATGSEAEIEEERRLFYVAMTRAKDFLNVYFPLRYYHRRFSHGDAHTFAQLTRFVTADVKSLFEIHTAMQTQEFEQREAEAKSKDPNSESSTDIQF